MTCLKDLYYKIKKHPKLLWKRHCESR